MRKAVPPARHSCFTLSRKSTADGARSRPISTRKSGWAPWTSQPCGRPIWN